MSINSKQENKLKLESISPRMALYAININFTKLQDTINNQNEVINDLINITESLTKRVNELENSKRVDNDKT